MSIRLEDCSSAQRRVLLALIALEKSPVVQREAEAIPAPASLGAKRHALAQPRRAA